MCPPSSSPTRSGRSRLTGVPTRQRAQRGAAPASRPTRRRRTSPAHLHRRQAAAGAGDRGAERDAGAVGPGRGGDDEPHVARRRRAGRSSRTVPRPVMMPVNIALSPSRIRSACRRRAASRRCAEARHRGQCLERRTPAPPASRRRRCTAGAWNQAMRSTSIGAQQRGGELRPALDQHAGDAARCARACQRRGRSTPGTRRRRTIDHRDARLAERLAAVGVGAVAGQDPGRGLGSPSRPDARSAACAGGCRRRRAPAGSRGSPSMRQVSSGSSASTVPTPTSTASCRPRSACAARRAGVAGDPLALAGPGGDRARPAWWPASASPAAGRGGRARQNPATASRPPPPAAPPHRDPGGAQPGDALRRSRADRDRPADHHAGDPGRDQRIGAGGGAALMAARLERHIGRGAARRRAGHGQRQRSRHAGARPARSRRDRPPDHRAR